MPRLVSTRCYRHIGGAAQQSIDQDAETEQVFQRADERRVLRRDGGRVEVRPLGGDQRLTPVRQNENELQAGRQARLSEHLQRLSLEWVVRTRDGHAFGPSVVELGEEGEPERWNRPRKGTPQGGVISPLLSNLCLHWFDKMFYRADGPAQWAGAKLVRYADDFVVLARYQGTRLTGWIESKLEGWLGW